MIRRRAPWLATALATVLCRTAWAQDAPEPGWTLDWQDEFDGAALDPGRWRIEDAALVKNNEKQYYSPANAGVRDGLLIITAERRAMGGRAYTSGLIDTGGLWARAFGRFEARMKLPRTRALWPAFWMLPEDGSWPPEIDIMESLGHEPTKAYHSNHYGPLQDRHHTTSEYAGPDLSQDFHVFRCDWLPGRLDFYVDGKKTASHTEGVPQKPMYVIFNLAVGGDWPGNPDATTVLPQTLEVDWVRVYEPVQAGRSYLSLNAEHGRASVEPAEYVFADGRQVVLTTTPDLGYRLARWEGAGSVGPLPRLDLTLRGNADVRAVFEPDPAGPVLLSRGKPARASSTQEGPYDAAFAVDGSRSRRWSSEINDPQWLLIDLQEPRLVRAVRLDWEQAFGSEYVVEGSLDSTSWVEFQRVTDGRPGERVILLSVPTQARYVRVTGLRRGTKWGYSLWELEVFGDL